MTRQNAPCVTKTVTQRLTLTQEDAEKILADWAERKHGMADATVEFDTGYDIIRDILITTTRTETEETDQEALAEARAEGMEEAVIAVRSKRGDPDNDNGLDLAEEAIRARAAKVKETKGDTYNGN